MEPGFGAAGTVDSISGLPCPAVRSSVTERRAATRQAARNVCSRRPCSEHYLLTDSIASHFAFTPVAFVAVVPVFGEERDKGDSKPRVQTGDFSIRAGREVGRTATAEEF
ncbi:cysteine proteinase precursor [Platysternon megacephalum]|uniref:Cysteine proteinase n=1 Tax=Platysternon megacephalum TaxID=55544 RepID=A0A4D9DL92_9SAUR|nr:cysteine proteinase precursor [Platysternon megacephalum]